MHYKTFFCLCCFGALTACSPTPTIKPTTTFSPTATVASGPKSISDKVLDNAYSWLGTPYRYGGTTKYGMDCSGLVYTVYSQADIELPRTSYEQAKAGKRIAPGDAMPGDLIFFRTSGRRISHVGIINQVKGHELSFIHSSESKGVIISSSENLYWKHRIVQVMRVINR